MERPYKHWNPTEDDLKKIESLAARGLLQKDICLCLDIHPDTLSHSKAENEQVEQAIKRGKAKGIARVTAALLKNVDNGNVTAQIFYLKTQAKWREADIENQNSATIMQQFWEKKATENKPE